MKRSLLLLIVSFLFIGNKSNAQTWSTVGGGIYGLVNQIMEYQGDVYAAGYFAGTGSGQANKIAKFNGTSWSALGLSADNNVMAMAIYKGELYAGGKFLNIGGIAANRIAKWNGSTWTAVGTGTDDVIRALAVDTVHNILYAAGDFTTAGGVSSVSIAQWNDTAWSALAPLSLNGAIQTLTMYKGQLLVGGNFGGSPGCGNIGIWTGTAWSKTGLGQGMNGNVHKLYVDHLNNLIIGGSFTTAGANSFAANSIVSWDGTNFTALGTGMSTTGIGVKSIVEFKGELYAGGDFTGAGAANAKFIARWNGTVWDSLSGGGVNNIVYALCTHNNELYAGGTFTMAGSMGAYYIAKYGTQVTSAVENTKEESNSLTVYPNPSNGNFIIKFNEKTKSNLFSVTIYNAIGERIYYAENTDLQNEIGIPNVSSGLYSLTINDGEKVYSKKIIIQTGD